MPQGGGLSARLKQHARAQDSRWLDEFQHSAMRQEHFKHGSWSGDTAAARPRFEELGGDGASGTRVHLLGRGFSDSMVLRQRQAQALAEAMDQGGGAGGSSTATPQPGHVPFRHAHSESELQMRRRPALIARSPLRSPPPLPPVQSGHVSSIPPY